MESFCFPYHAAPLVQVEDNAPPGASTLPPPPPASKPDPADDDRIGVRELPDGSVIATRTQTVRGPDGKVSVISRTLE